MSYGNRIAELRRKRNLTQEELANQLKISRAALSHYEQNRREPDFGTLNSIANYFKVTIDYILGRTDDPTAQLDKETLNFMKNLELSEKDLFTKFSLMIDGRALTQEEAKRFVAFIRAERSMSNG